MTFTGCGLERIDVFKRLLYVFLLFLPASCSIIDEDREGCDIDFSIHYEVTLKTNLSTQVQTVLRSRFETEVADLLEDSLKNIFREYANDVDLSFYVGQDIAQHIDTVLGGNQRVYEMELEANNYRHLALANIQEENEVKIQNIAHVNSSQLSQQLGDTIVGHNTGLFSARKDMNVTGTQDQNFDVTLYMVNSASILVVRTDKVAYNDIKVYSTDFADGFLVNDSVFTFNSNPIVRDYRVTSPPVEREVFYTVTFPSDSTALAAHSHTRAVVGSDDDQTGADEEERIWRKYIYVTLPNGSITRTVINVREPLRAGEVMIIYAFMREDGSIFSPNVEVTTSVKLDWKPGQVINPSV